MKEITPFRAGGQAESSEDGRNPSDATHSWLGELLKLSNHQPDSGTSDV